MNKILKATYEETKKAGQVDDWYDVISIRRSFNKINKHGAAKWAANSFIQQLQKPMGIRIDTDVWNSMEDFLGHKSPL